MKRGQVVLWGGWRTLGHVQYRSAADRVRSRVLNVVVRLNAGPLLQQLAEIRAKLDEAERKALNRALRTGRFGP